MTWQEISVGKGFQWDKPPDPTIVPEIELGNGKRSISMLAVKSKAKKKKEVTGTSGGGKKKSKFVNLNIANFVGKVSDIHGLTSDQVREVDGQQLQNIDAPIIDTDMESSEEEDNSDSCEDDDEPIQVQNVPFVHGQKNEIGPITSHESGNLANPIVGLKVGQFIDEAAVTSLMGRGQDALAGCVGGWFVASNELQAMGSRGGKGISLSDSKRGQIWAVDNQFQLNDHLLDWNSMAGKGYYLDNYMGCMDLREGADMCRGNFQQVTLWHIRDWWCREGLMGNGCTWLAWTARATWNATAADAGRGIAVVCNDYCNNNGTSLLQSCGIKQQLHGRNAVLVQRTIIEKMQSYTDVSILNPYSSDDDGKLWSSFIHQSSGGGGGNFETQLYSSVFSVAPDMSTIPHQPIVVNYSHNNSPEFRTFKDLIDRRNRCLTNLRLSTKEAETLRQENLNLQKANSELNKQLSHLQLQAHSTSSLQDYANPTMFPSENSIVNCFGRMKIGEKGTTAADKREVREGENVDPIKKTDTERVKLPKSISVRSKGYLKKIQAADESASRSQDHDRVKPASDMLCNKWQQTGACPYGDHCQFAHGIEELRPVIRHPLYKTQVCRMVLAGDPCPYGHRCHFRHALTEEEKLMSRQIRS
ncbi:hypothetical protein E3N88_40511 [Mikania micrantha]|uniref:C3H1-type domain-containing protein n=1 Tax=Mikania micrantha TaxID=192012 RepID=A0A5N6LMY6_9ASTR|nr:hypothetical protein E3N88_40511 [Mikania micrantha]